MPKPLQAAQKGPDARRRPRAAREAYSLYVDRAAEGANAAAGPFSSLYTAASAYFRRRRLRKLMANRFRSTTMPSRSKVVANTMGRAASTLGDWKPTS